MLLKLIMSCDYECHLYYMPHGYEEREYDQGKINICGNKKMNTNKKNKFICGLPIILGKTKCEFHQCVIDGCRNHKSGNVSYCDKHSCKYRIRHGWSSNLCCEKTVDDSIYCVNHKCQICKCAVFNAKVRKCKNHLTEMICQFENCDNVFPVDSNIKNCDDTGIVEVAKNFGMRFSNLEDKDYITKSHCDKHTCVKCGVSGIMSEETQYCCFDIPQDDPVYVEKQENEYCENSGCGKYKFERNDSKFCKKHTCKYEGCSHPRLEDETEMGDLMFRSKYCHNHHLLNELCLKNYNFDIKMLNILNFVDMNSRNLKTQFIKKIKERSDELK